MNEEWKIGISWTCVYIAGSCSGNIVAETLTDDDDGDSQEEQTQPLAKRPKASDLKINPKNYIPKIPEERSQPTTRYAHSDSDSDLEGAPENQISAEHLKNLSGRYPLKRPPKKTCVIL